MQLQLPFLFRNAVALQAVAFEYRQHLRLKGNLRIVRECGGMDIKSAERHANAQSDARPLKRSDAAGHAHEDSGTFN